MPTVLVTRPQPDADHLAQVMREKNFDVIVDPLFKTDFATTPPERENYQALLATSRNAIRALAKNGAVKYFSHLPLLAVGEETATEARLAGFKHIKNAEGAADSLGALVVETCLPGKGPLLYLAGKTRKAALESGLAAQGFEIAVWEAYAMHPSPALNEKTLGALRQNAVAAVLLFSERAAAHFLQLAQALDWENVNAPLYACLSAQVALPLQNKGLRAIYPSIPSLHALIELLPPKNH